MSTSASATPKTRKRDKSEDTRRSKRIRRESARMRQIKEEQAQLTESEDNSQGLCAPAL